MNTGTNKTLWELLDTEKIRIPVIQRDYAQGRKNAGYIRKAFLGELRGCLRDGKELSLDFVYGTEKDGIFEPLDGQQRLTTLWLLYWYTAFKTGKLKDSDVWRRLKRFTYEIRSSSAEFFEALCEKGKDMQQKGETIGDLIRSQNWFYSIWLQDPTIDSALRTLEGTFTVSRTKKGKEEKKSNEDGIEPIFKEKTFKALWDKLTEKRLITFELMRIGSDQLPVSDDLYIKMNARGKSLTDFENFKADLIGWLQQENNENASTYSAYATYSMKLDGAWTDIFWSAGEKNGKIDDAYFSFINRFCLNELCLQRDNSASELVNSREKSGNSSEAFDRLYCAEVPREDKSDEPQRHYEGFDIYKEILAGDNLQKLAKILRQLENRQNAENIEKWADDIIGKNNESFHFIPQYEENEVRENEVRRPTQKERVYFLAVSIFLEKMSDGEAIHERQLKDWLRVVRNLTENAEIASKEAMISCMRKISELGEGCRNILQYLKDRTKPGKESLLEKQEWEEIEKAKHITSCPGDRDKIIEAENHAFFNGTIRFLYHNPDGNPDWDHFDRKFSSCRSLFTKDNEVPTETIRKFLNLFKNFTEIAYKHYFTKIGYHSRNSCWKKDILCSEDRITTEKVHQLLMGAMDAPTGQDKIYWGFVQSELLDKICNHGKNHKFEYRSSEEIIQKKYGHYNDNDVVYVGEKRIEKNKILLAIADHVEEKSFEQNDSKFIWGREIAFSYGGKEFLWMEETADSKGIFLQDGKKYLGPWNNEAELIKILQDAVQGNSADSRNGGERQICTAFAPSAEIAPKKSQTTESPVL